MNIVWVLSACLYIEPGPEITMDRWIADSDEMRSEKQDVADRRLEHYKPLGENECWLSKECELCNECGGGQRCAHTREITSGESSLDRRSTEDKSEHTKAKIAEWALTTAK